MKLKFSLKYSLLILCLLTIVIESSSNIKKESSASNWITSTLLKNIQHQWKDDHCSLKIVSLSSSFYHNYTVLNFKIFHNFSEPLQVANLSELQHKNIPTTHRLKAAFKGHCWSIIISIISEGDFDIPKDFSYKPLGHPVRDNFIVISSSYSKLEAFLFQTEALNVIRSKYGMYLPLSTGNALNFKYLVESQIYNGGFVSYTSAPVNPKIFNNLNGRVIKLIHLNLGLSFRKISNHSRVGVYHDIFVEYTKKLNFSIDYYNEKLPPGNPDKNGTWTGLVGELQHGSADICAALGVSYQRYSYIDYSTETHRAPLSFTVEEPKAQIQWYALVSPLTPQVWLYTVGSLLGLTLTIIFMEFIGNFTETDGADHIWHIFKAVLIPYTIVLEQSAKLSGSLVLRLTAVLCILLNFVIGTAYKSNLVGFLTFPLQPLFPKSFHDLYIQKGYELTLLTVGGMENEVFKTSTSPIMQDFSKRLKIIGAKQARNCLDASMRSNMVCISWRDLLKSRAIEYTLEFPHLKRSIFMADASDPVLYADLATAFKKGSIYQAILNKYLAYFRDTGVVDKLLRKYWQEEKVRLTESFHKKKKEKSIENSTAIENLKGSDWNNFGTSHDDGKPVALKVENLVAVGFAYIFGIVIVVISFLFEIFVTLLEKLRKLSLVKDGHA